MPTLITLDETGLQGRVAERPVSVQEYRDYLRITGQAMPRLVAQGCGPHEAVTYVSQVAALAYCRWLSQQERQAYRLPSVGELIELAGQPGLEGSSQEIWPHSHAERPEIQGARGALCLCEWTCETEELHPAGGGPPRVLGSVFYPPWLREGNNPKQIQGMMLADQGYSFVSFRVAAAE